VTIWPISFVLALLAILFHQTDHTCMRPVRNNVYITTLLLAFCFCVVGYVVTAAMVCRSVPLSVHKLTWKRAMAYPLNFLVCYSLTVIGNLVCRSSDSVDIWGTPGFVLTDHCLLGLTGAANAFAYFWQSRYARIGSRVARQDSQADSIFRSFHVRFVDTNDVLPVDFESLRTDSEETLVST
jgi:hypothetical protein